MLKATTSSSRPRLGAAAQRCATRNPILITSANNGSNQQSRGFRFCPWTSDVDAEAKRRRRLFRYKYMEALTQRPTWGEVAKKRDTKEAEDDYRPWSHRSSPVGTYLNIHMKCWPDILRPGKKSGIVDGGVADIETHSAGTGPSSDRRPPWDPFRGFRSSDPPRASTLKPASELYERHFKAKPQNTFIDPITNRRVSRTPTPSADPLTTSESQTSPVEVHKSDAAQPSSGAKGIDINESAQQQHGIEDSTGSMKGMGESCEEPSKETTRDADSSFSIGTTLPKPPTTRESRRLRTDWEETSAPVGPKKYGSVRMTSEGQLDSSKELPKRNPDLDSYGPFYWNEPGGQPKSTADESSKQYMDLDRYNKPFGVEDTMSAESERPQVAYRPKVDSIPRKVERLEGQSTYDDLHKYGPVYWNEPDGLPKSYEEARQKPSDLHEYSNRNRSPNVYMRSWVGKQTNPKYDRDKIQEEPASPQFPQSPNILMTPQTGSSTVTQTSHEMHGDQLAPFNAKHPEKLASPRSSRELVGSTRRPESGEATDSMSASEIRADVFRRVKKTNQERKKGRLDVDSNKWPDGKMGAPRSERRLTGNFVRDFPEDFSTTWSTANSTNKSTLVPSDASFQSSKFSSSTLGDLDKEVEASSMDESFPTEETKLEPALNRSARLPRASLSPREVERSESDFDTKGHADPLLSDTKDIGERQTEPVYKRHWEAEAKVPEAGSEFSTDKSARIEREPTMYKILAYDPTSDAINIAEATSSTSETPPPSSPASVLPCLSSPYKFLPYFATLRQQGYEIESGSGNVLVFRKIRAGTPGASSKLVELHHSKEAPVNPIDMMGKPVTGNFASPTGFVNYDLADRGECKTTPPFRARSVTTEEEWQQEPTQRMKPKRRVGRKIMIGTAWTFGIAYAAGVLGEYFATGGADGLGPRGL
ncbi:hypothetical protein HIM_03398 [Hirsutella minnesotensis 3608]|uniref:Uncharacterized protein n=1 Tax=Hirsutella minnesotensis 3608 TaxID=1043627 RepID=A0A0F8A2K8_9HYPO|nr:hypothetical protein HIM_03398 [Hirsutella minnesotensis 3608]